MITSSLRLVVVVHLTPSAHLWLSSHWWLHRLLLVHHVCSTSVDKILLHLASHLLHQWVCVSELLLDHLLVWLHHNGINGSEHIHIIGIIHVVKNDTHVFLTDALLIKEVSYCIHITAHLFGFLKEFFPFIEEVHWNDRLLGVRPH